MPDRAVWLCEGCPGKGSSRVDFGVNGSCPRDMVDSFRQARLSVLEDPGEHQNADAELIAREIEMNGIRYYDPEEDEFFETRADYESARLGALCAQRFLKGECPKAETQIIAESEVD